MMAATTSVSSMVVLATSRGLLRRYPIWAQTRVRWTRGCRRLSSPQVHVQRDYNGNTLSYAHTTSDIPLDSMTIGGHLSKTARLFPKKTALISAHEGISWSFEDVDKLATQAANVFKNDLGLKFGDVIALWSSNSATNIIVNYAAARLGLVMSTLNPAYREDELRFALQESGAKVILLPGKNSRQETVNRFWDVLSAVDMTGLDNLKFVVALDGQITDSKVEGLTYLRMDDLHGSSDAVDQDFPSDAPSIIMFTSGTTGRPKGAVLSHFNLVNHSRLMSSRLSIDETSISCIPVPLFHIFGMVYGSVTMSVMASSIVLTGYRYNARDVIKGIQSNKCTHAMIVPAMTVDILKMVEDTKEDLPSLKYLITGSAPTPPELAKKFISTFPNLTNFYIRYGSTETGGCMTMPFPTDNPMDGVNRVGAPLDHTQLKICHPQTGRIVPTGQEGEVWVRGHHVMLGYWKQPEKTAEAIENGWFKTGDMGVMEEDGYIWLKGRSKEMVIRGGENIYPKEIENLLHQHPAVQEAHVCGVPDDRVGEEICAWIKVKDGESTTEDDIRMFCKDRISYFKVPKFVLFVEDFPRTPKGSPQKYVMKEKSIEMLGLGRK